MGTSVAGLKRSLGLWDLIFIGIVIIQPVAPMGIFGVIHNKSGGHAVTAILFAMIAMLLTAISYGRMARVYPNAGSAYTYVTNEVHPAVGYLTGWAMVMDYILNPLICTIICSKLTQNILPEVPYWVLAVFFAGAFTWLNLRGIKTSARINEVLATGMTIIVIIFFAAVIRYVYGIYHDGITFFTQPFYNRETFDWSRIFHGTSIAVLTYIGFDGISTLSEEVENPRRNIMLATVLVCLFAGVISALEVYAAQLVWGAKPFPPEMVESAFPLVSKQIAGMVLFHLLNFTILIANIGSGMAAQLAAARLLYGMGRNDALPKGVFGAIHPKRRVPHKNVMIVGAIALAGAFLLEIMARHGGEGGYAVGTQLLNFGAVIAFMGVNLSAFAHYYLRGKRSITNFLPPILGFLFCLAIWVNLSRTAMKAGLIWLVVGIVYGAYKTRGFRDIVKFEEAAG